MSTIHSGNMLNSITFEEHDGTLNAKKVNIIGSTATIFAVVNTAAAGQASVVLDTGRSFIGIVTIANPSSFTGNLTLDPGSRTGILGNLTLSDSKGFIGLTTTTVGSPLPAGANFIGLVTIVGSLAPAAGNVTLDAGSLTGVRGNLTLSDSKGFIGLVTVGNVVSTTFSGNVTLDAGSKTQIAGNVTLSDSKGFIGLVTATSIQGGNWDVAVVRGNVTVQQGTTPWSSSIVGNVTISDSKGFIGLTTSVLASSPAFIGIVTVTNRDMTLTGNVTLSDSKGFIGLVTVVQSSSARTITGNVTLSDSKGYIGLVTAFNAYGSGSTVYTGVISASGNTTVLVAPASNRFFIKNLHISSLGRSEVEIRSGATTLVPFTSLSTTSGFNPYYGEMGLPARAQADALVINLNGSTTIAYMANVRFEA